MKKRIINNVKNIKQEIQISYHQNLVNAINNYEKSKIDVAVAFYNAYEKKEDNGAYCWQNKGYITFKEYVEQEFGFEYRNAM